MTNKISKRNLYMNIHNKIALLGGDARMIYALSVLSDRGFEVAAWGFGKSELPSFSVRVRDIEDAISHCRAVILPTPASRDSITLYSPLHDRDAVTLSHLISLLPDDCTLIGGALSPALKKMIEDRALSYYDICESEDFATKNAIPTAEGALAIAISEMPATLMDSRCAVIGYGKCGSAMAKCLHSLGGNVSVFARKKTARDNAELLGYESFSTSELEKLCGYDLIVNTAPARLFDTELLKKIKRDALVLDIASAPYCTDEKIAAEIGVKYLRAPSLPGKYSPLSAGKIIGECALDILNMEGITP